MLLGEPGRERHHNVDMARLYKRERRSGRFHKRLSHETASNFVRRSHSVLPSKEKEISHRRVSWQTSGAAKGYAAFWLLRAYFTIRVLDDPVRIHLVLVGDGVAQRFIQVRRLETERLEVERRTAVLSSSSFEGLDEVVFRCLDGERKPLPELL